MRQACNRPGISGNVPGAKSPLYAESAPYGVLAADILRLGYRIARYPASGRGIFMRALQRKCQISAMRGASMFRHRSAFSRSSRSARVTAPIHISASCMSGSRAESAIFTSLMR